MGGFGLIVLVFAASVKRSHESWLSGNGGFWEDQKASSTSPASRSTEANSPSSSNVSIRKKMVDIAVFMMSVPFLQTSVDQF